MPVPRPDIPLPAAWPEHARSAVLFAIALAHYALAIARGWCANSRIARVRLAADNDRLKTEVALLREELRIKDARMAHIQPRERPHYPPTERMAGPRPLAWAGILRPYRAGEETDRQPRSRTG